MKRLSSEPIVDRENDNAKKIRSNEDNSIAKNQEYLQLILNKITELQQEFQENDYDYDDDETSDLGDSEPEDTDEDIMNEVLTKVFEDLPEGPYQTNADFSNPVQKPLQSDTSKDTNIELCGFQVCRKVAMNFVKDITQPTTYKNIPGDVQDCNFNQAELETRKQMLRSFDLHLAAKERDYAIRLVGE